MKRKKINDLQLAMEIAWNDLHRPRDYAFTYEERKDINDELIRMQEIYREHTGEYYPLT